VRARGAVPIGVDVAGAMVELARGLHPGIEFIQASAADLPFDDESFDAVLGNFMILHVGESERVAREIVRSLRPGGAVETQQRIRAAFDARIAELRTNGEVELPTSVKIASARKAAP
jgi:ubiquinone/menaquinone biosynthesis C-methylase UbiE